jgi:hypothetical protein
MERLDAYTYACSIYEEIRLLFIELGLTVDITNYLNTSRVTYENAINNLTPSEISKGVLLYPLGDFNYKTTQINSIFINYLNALDIAQQAVSYNIGGVRQNIYFQINILAKNYKDAEYIANLIHAKFYRHSGHKTYDLETNQFSIEYFYSVSDFGIEANKVGKADLEHVVEYIIAIGLHQVPIIFNYTQAEIEYGIFQKLNTVLKINDNDYSIETEYNYNVGDTITHTDISLNQYFNIVKAGYTYNVADKPLLWYLGGYYSTFKGDTFEVSGEGDIFAGDDIDYAAVTGIDLNNQSLTTYFNFLDKFVNLKSLILGQNPLVTLLDNFDKSKLIYLGLNFCSLVSINIDDANLLEEVYMLNVPIGNIDFTQKIKLRICNFQNTNATNANLSNCTLLEDLNYAGNDLEYINIDNLLNLSFLKLQGNLLSDLNISNNELLIQLRLQNNQLSNLVNSKILEDLDSHGLSNGYFQSTIFGGGSLTAAGLPAKANLQAKGWTIVGI